MREVTHLRRTEEIFGPFLLQEAFLELARLAAEFSTKTFSLTESASRRDPSTSAQINLRNSKSIFGKWNIEILTLLSTQREMRFQEIRRSLGSISTAILAQKLNSLQEKEMIRRSVLGTKPPRVRYAITERGLTLARLSEPLFLYLRFIEELPFAADDELKNGTG